VRPVIAGNVPGEEAIVAFRVLPPWYRTPVAWFTYCVGTIAALVFIVWLSSYLQRRENERLERVVAQRTRELSGTNQRLEFQIEETVVKSNALAASEERYRVLNSELEERVRQRAAELEELHKQLVATSRKAGMAEVATGVLHNVGNVLNSVNVSANLVRETLHSSEIGSFERVADLLRQHEKDIGDYVSTDARGRLLPSFLVQLSEQLAIEHKAIARETEQLSKNIEHIKGIVAMQQSYATVSGVQEEVSIAELVRDAIHMHFAGLQRHGIRIDCEFAEVPLMLVDKHKVLQILVNLIKNAKHAICDTHREDGRIVVKIVAGENDRARISISDNGVGIPPENLVKIFSHGFTTKAGGHGFGLHSGALAARELGGALRAESAGSGRGATFILELPITASRSVS
jgi:C4-dicarboxylate-specific signal transduction histidine kinase